MARGRRRSQKPVDKFQAALRDPFERAASSGWAILYGIGAVAFLFMGLVFLIRTHDRKEDMAWEALEKANIEGAAEAYERVAGAHVGSTATPVALYRAALQRYERARADDALDKAKKEDLKQVVSLAQELVEGYPDHFLSALAHEVWGLALEDQARHKEAIEVYLRGKETNEDGFLGAKFEYHLAKNYAALHKLDRARTHVQKALSLTEDPQSRAWEWRRRAEYLDLLVRAAAVEGVPALDGKKKDAAQPKKEERVERAPKKQSEPKKARGVQKDPAQAQKTGKKPDDTKPLPKDTAPKGADKPKVKEPAPAEKKAGAQKGARQPEEAGQKKPADPSPPAAEAKPTAPSPGQAPAPTQPANDPEPKSQ